MRTLHWILQNLNKSCIETYKDKTYEVSTSVQNLNKSCIETAAVVFQQEADGNRTLTRVVLKRVLRRSNSLVSEQNLNKSCIETEKYETIPTFEKYRTLTKVVLKRLWRTTKNVICIQNLNKSCIETNIHYRKAPHLFIEP